MVISGIWVLKTILGRNTIFPALIQELVAKYYLTNVRGLTRCGVIYAGDIAGLRNGAKRFRHCSSWSDSCRNFWGYCFPAMGMVVNQNRISGPESASTHNLMEKQFITS